MASLWVDSILDDLEFLTNNLDMDHDSNKIMRLELKFLKTSLLCAKKWNMESFYFSIEDAIHKRALGIHSLCLRSTDNGSFSRRSLDDVVSSLKGNIEYFKPNIYNMYTTLLRCFEQSPSPMSNELTELIDSLVENLKNLLQRNEVRPPVKELIEALEEKLTFLKYFCCFAIFRGVENRLLKDLLAHIEFIAVGAALLSYTCWFRRDYRFEEDWNAEIKSFLSELIQKIRPLEPQTRETYIKVLTASELSGSSHTRTVDRDDDHIVRDFIESLLGNLWEILNLGTSFQVPVKDQMQLLYQGLRFLRNILRNPQEKCNKLTEEIKDLIGAVGSESGTVIFSLFANLTKEGLGEEMNLALLDLLEKIEHIKVVVAKKHPVPSTFNFPRTNELGFIDFLLENLKELVSCKVNSIAFAEDQIQIIQDDLVFLRSFLDNIVELRNQHEELQILWSRVIEVAYNVEFVFDSLSVGDIPDYSPTLFNTIIDQIKGIKTEALETFHNKRHDIELQKVTKTSTQVPSRGSNSIPIVSEVVVGFDDEAEVIMDRLIRGSMQQDVVSIVGMPGLGKTALAQKVYNDPSIMFHFHIRAWCYLSQVYSKHSVLLKILDNIVAELPEKYFDMDEDDLAQKLYRCLKGNRYLIVLDDVWDVGGCIDLVKSFPDEANGSRVLLTSRLYDVASQVKPESEPHRLRLFTNDESWKLLQKMLFAKESCPPQLCSLGMRIANRCKGLPLVVVIIAGILSNTEQDGWEKALESLSSDVYDTEYCMKTLELSYKHLPDYLRPCLLYFGAFPEDQEIPVWRLMSLWISEGFVQKSEFKSLEDIAEEYLMDLIGRSLVMVAKQRFIGGVKSCRVHDLLHEFCVAKAKEENFLNLLHGYDELSTFNEPHNVRRLCIYSTREQFKKSRVHYPRVRSLLLFTHGNEQVPKQYNVSFVFRIFKLLSYVGDIFPREISSLVNLRYFAIQGKIKAIPSSIDKLLQLETFIIEGLHDAVLLPDTFWNMKKLRHLHINGFDLVFCLPYDNLESPNLYNLDTLSTPIFFFGTSMQKIRNLPNIRRLKCKVGDSAESDGGSNRILSLEFLSKLESLKVDLFGPIQYQIEFSFPLNLKELTLLSMCQPCGKISTIGKLPNLEVLKLFHKAFVGKFWDVKEGEFPKLKFLKLKFLDVVKWTASDDSFPSLQKLVLKQVYLTEMPSCLEYISTLEMIELHYCGEVSARLVKQIQEEQMAIGNEGLEIQIFEYPWSTSD